MHDMVSALKKREFEQGAFAMDIKGVSKIAMIAVSDRLGRHRTCSRPISLKIPDGLAFADFKGYDTWQTVAVSETEGSLKAILANPAMIEAYKDGISGNGNLFPKAPRS